MIELRAKVIIALDIPVQTIKPMESFVRSCSDVPIPIIPVSISVFGTVDSTGMRRIPTTDGYKMDGVKIQSRYLSYHICNTVHIGAVGNERQAGSCVYIQVDSEPHHYIDTVTNSFYYLIVTFVPIRITHYNFFREFYCSISTSCSVCTSVDAVDIHITVTVTINQRKGEDSRSTILSHRQQ